MKKIPYSETERVESGGVQFGDDWPGLFLRGDDALFLNIVLLDILKGETLSETDLAFLAGLNLTIVTEVRIPLERKE